MTRRIINGRAALDRAGVRELTGAALITIKVWYRDRATNGFPDIVDPVLTGDRHHWWWERDIRAFYTAHQNAKEQKLTRVDRGGDPDELLGTGEAARVLGYARYDSLPPELDDLADDVHATPGNRPRRRWKRSTLWTYADSRTGPRGGGPAPTSSNRTAAARRTLDHSGDPDELVGATEAARVLGYAAYDSLPQSLYAIADRTAPKPGGHTYHEWKRATLWTFAAPAI